MPSDSSHEDLRDLGGGGRRAQRGLPGKSPLWALVSLPNDAWGRAGGPRPLGLVSPAWVARP